MAKESVQKNTLTRLYDGKRRVRTYLIEFAHITNYRIKPMCFTVTYMSNVT